MNFAKMEPKNLFQQFLPFSVRGNWMRGIRKHQCLPFLEQVSYITGEGWLAGTAGESLLRVWFIGLVNPASATEARLFLDDLQPEWLAT